MGIRSKNTKLNILYFKSYPKIAMAQLVKAKKAENIPVLSGRLVFKVKCFHLYLVHNFSL